MSIIQPFVIPKHYQRKDGCSEFFVYRGDLEHSHAPGNKWHKLKYHLSEAEKRQARYLATFGGPYSNHLHAFAQTLKDSPYEGICVVRGELQPQLTPTLQDVASCGMELWPSLRRDYKLGVASDVAKRINQLYPDVYWIPEGGGGVLGARGCLDWARNIDHLDNKYDAWVVSAGTGTTSAGILAYQNEADLHVVSALKGAHEQRNEILALAGCLIKSAQGTKCLSSALKNTLDHRLFFHSNAHQGGYAKHSDELLEFIKECHESNPDLMLDPVYTCKTFFHIIQRWRDGLWPYQRTLFIHTGGLQGWRGYS